MLSSVHYVELHINSKGYSGEKLARINQKGKHSFTIHNMVRVPVAIKGNKLIEVKNVRYIANTLQLRDYADIANKYGFQLVLKVRPTTKFLNLLWMRVG